MGLRGGPAAHRRADRGTGRAGTHRHPPVPAPQRRSHRAARHRPVQDQPGTGHTHVGRALPRDRDDRAPADRARPHPARSALRRPRTGLDRADALPVPAPDRRSAAGDQHRNDPEQPSASMPDPRRNHPAFRGLHFTPHDFRRLFATDLVNNRLPIHLGAALLGHVNLQTTQGYVAVFEEDVIRHTQDFLARRRAMRPKRSTGRPPTRSGTNSRNTSTSARSSSARVVDPTEPAASTNTPACVAHSYTSTQRCCPDSTNWKAT